MKMMVMLAPLLVALGCATGDPLTTGESTGGASSGEVPETTTPFLTTSSDAPTTPTGDGGGSGSSGSGDQSETGEGEDSEGDEQGEDEWETGAEDEEGEAGNEPLGHEACLARCELHGWCLRVEPDRCYAECIDAFDTLSETCAMLTDERNACVGMLECPGYAAWLDGSGTHDCVEVQAEVDACDE